MGTMGFANLVAPLIGATGKAGGPAKLSGTLGRTHFKPKAKRVIYLFMSGGPSHIDMFDYHPKLREYHGQELPDSIRNGQRITGMTSKQSSFPCVAPMFEFTKHGQNGTWFSEIVPHTASIADDICLIKSMHTEAINHDPAITAINTGSQQPGKPAMGAWLDWGMGSPNQNLPGYVVMISRGKETYRPSMTDFGAVVFFPPSIRALSSVQQVTPCFISPIQMELPEVCEGICLMASRRLTKAKKYSLEIWKLMPESPNTKWLIECRPVSRNWST